MVIEIRKVLTYGEQERELAGMKEIPYSLI